VIAWPFKEVFEVVADVTKASLGKLIVVEVVSS
jgi:hypothetical protein